MNDPIRIEARYRNLIRSPVLLEFLAGVEDGSLCDSPARVIGDGRGYWRFGLLTSICDELAESRSDVPTIRDCALALLEWLALYRQRYQREVPDVNARFAGFLFPGGPTITVLCTYSDVGEQTTAAFYSKEWSVYRAIERRSLLRDMDVVPQYGEMEIGFLRMSRGDKWGRGFCFGELWAIGDLTTPWRDLWHQLPRIQL